MPAPMIDDVELTAVQYIAQETDQDFVRQKIPGLDGTLHQKLGRKSHRVVLSGLLLPATAADDLKTLQEKAKAGEEVTFTADITTALEVEKMVIESFHAEQHVGPAGQVAYTIVLTESPPLPPPAELSPFGGLGDFGLGDMGFDPGALDDLLGDIQDQAGALMDAADAALDAIGQIAALADLANIGDITNPMRPITDRVSQLGEIGPAVTGLKDLIGGLE